MSLVIGGWSLLRTQVQHVLGDAVLGAELPWSSKSSCSIMGKQIMQQQTRIGGRLYALNCTRKVLAANMY